MLARYNRRCYIKGMFEWDEGKARFNLAKHGIAFEDVKPAFFAEEALIFEDDRRDYGEARFILLGPLEGVMVHVTYTKRGETVRIISARRANARERRGYEQIRSR